MDLRILQCRGKSISAEIVRSEYWISIAKDAEDAPLRDRVPLLQAAARRSWAAVRAAPPDDSQTE